MSANLIHAIDCRKAEDLLVRQSIESLGEQEGAMLSQHLAVCELCRSYKGVVADLPDQVKAAPSPSLRPDPAVYESLVQHLESRKAGRTEPEGIFSEVFARAFRSMVPVYAAGVALVAVLVGGFLFSWFSGNQNRETLLVKDSAQVRNPKVVLQDTVLPVKMTAPAKQRRRPARARIVQAKAKSRSVAEDNFFQQYDTVMVRYSQPAMIEYARFEW